jgi:hypothetical protein
MTVTGGTTAPRSTPLLSRINYRIQRWLQAKYRRLPAAKAGHKARGRTVNLVTGNAPAIRDWWPGRPSPAGSTRRTGGWRGHPAAEAAIRQAVAHFLPVPQPPSDRVAG